MRRRNIQVVGMTFAAAFVLLTLVGVVFARRAYHSATSWVQHTSDVKLAIDSARIDLEESTPRGTGDAAGFARVRDDVLRIRQLTRDNPRQQARLDVLEPEVDAAIELGRVGRLTDAQSDRLRALLAQMLAEEDALMSVRTAEQDAQRQKSWLVLGICACLACGFAIAAILTLRRQSRALFRQTALFSAILESMGDGVLALDSEKRFLVVNAALRRVFGDVAVGDPVSPEWVAATKPLDADGAPLPVSDRGPVVRALAGEAIDGVDFSILPFGGSSERRWMSATCRPVRDEAGEIIAAVGIMRDVTRERAERELLERQAEELRKQSLVDELTGLYNRRGFLFLANQYARTAARRKQRFATLFLDLNGLKAINDTLGHDVGDQAIRRMGKLLKATLRESDIAARLGGDEYVALIDGADEATVTRILERIGRQIELEGKGKVSGYELSVSSGAAYQVEGGARSIDDLLGEADRRMYAQKSKRGSHRARASA